MARERYPSDEKRARPFVRVHLTIRNHPTYGHVFDDPMLRGIWLGVLVVARQAFAGETGDVVTLSAGDVNWIAGTRDLRHGLPRLRKLCDAMAWDLTGVTTSARRLVDNSETPPRRLADASEASPRRWEVEVRNLQRKQSPYSAISRSKRKRTINEDEEEDESPRSARKRAPSADAVQFAEDFRKALQQTGKMRRTLTDSAFERWTIEADRMLRRDGIKIEEARELCAWIFRSEDEEARFWRATSRSVPNFRRNYDQINAQRERARGERDGRGGEGRAAAERIARRRGVIPAGDDGTADPVRSDARRLPAGEKPGRGNDG